jgi:hypothetical protein
MTNEIILSESKRIDTPNLGTYKAWIEVFRFNGEGDYMNWICVHGWLDCEDAGIELENNLVSTVRMSDKPKELRYAIAQADAWFAQCGKTVMDRSFAEYKQTEDVEP